MAPPSPPAAPDILPGATPRLNELLLRLGKDSGFPALSAQMLRVQQIASSETESLSKLTSEILKDVALTNKLLRLVNSAEFAHQGGIGTVSRAISLIGFSNIRNLATGLVLLEHMENRVHASQLRNEFLRALFAATLATDLCRTAQEQEQVFLAAMFQNLGRLLAEFYMPQVAQQVRDKCQGDQSLEQSAARQILGVDFDTLGNAVAQMWGLPEGIRRMMIRPEGPPPARAPHEPHVRMRWLALAANELADTLLQNSPDLLDAALARQTRRYAACLDTSADHIKEATLAVRTKLSNTVMAIGLVVPGSATASRLLSQHEHPPVEAVDSQLPPGLETLEDAAPETAGTSTPAQTTVATVDVLARGVEDVTQAMVDGVEVNTILRSILETIYRALGAQRVLFCLKEPGTEVLTGRFGIGADAARTARAFRADMATRTDLFGAICRSGRDTLMQDTQSAQIAARLPAWFARECAAQTLLLLPLQAKGNTFALICADKAQAHGIELQEREMTLLKTLRNQAVMALRQTRS
ncbi:MAG TPA: HDOD domain-containing protein [Macromonas sp.]|nr:HDOD domain-containing protein [Macromonas sp.]